MKKSYILTSLALASLGFFAFQHATSETSVVEKFNKEHLFSSGGQSGLTGAPGEQNCTQCHSGTAVVASSENSFALVDASFAPVSSYVPGDTYTASLQFTSQPAKYGFSSTTLDGTDQMAGALIGSGIGGTQNFNSGGRDYVSHTNSSNSGGTLFAWSWVAPATDVGPVTFYIASNITNDDGSTTGDVIHLSEHTIGSTASIGEEIHDPKFVAGYNATTNKLMVDFNSLRVGEMHLNLVDMNGRSVFNYDLGLSEIGENNESITLPSDLSGGMYVVHYFVGNKGMTANILVKK
ncbi:MAG: choice-of-anchor V domain-containing protein [Crocinitomicaceae bacterium]